MTWTIKDLPQYIQSKPSHILEKGLDAANIALSKGLTTDEAIFACLQRIKAVEGRSKTSAEPLRKVPEHVKQLLKAKIDEPETQSKIKQQFLGKNALTPDQNRNLVNAEFNTKDQLVLTFDTGETITTKSVAIKEYIENYLNVTTGSTGEITGLTNPTDFLGFNTSSGLVADVGELVWNDTDGTLDLGLKGGEVTLQIGQEQHVRILNKTGVTMTTPQVVRLSGAQGNRLTAELSIASNGSFADNTFAVVTENILNNQQGFATTSGVNLTYRELW